MMGFLYECFILINSVTVLPFRILRYMVEQLGFTPDNAIAAFNRARGHEMERSLYIEIIKNLDKNK